MMTGLAWQESRNPRIEGLVNGYGLAAIGRLACAPQGKRPGVAVYVPACSRCGGAGGSNAWRHTGWKCFDCNGSGRASAREQKVYTAEQYAVLCARRERMAAKRSAEEAARAQAARQEADARRAAFEAEHGQLLDDALRADRLLTEMSGAPRPVAYGDSEDGEAVQPMSITASIVDGARRRALLTPNMAAALARTIERHVERVLARLEAERVARHVGKVGERIKKMPVTVARYLFEKHAQGYGDRSFYIIALTAAGGETIVYKGGTWLGEPGTRLLLSFTVAAHDHHKGLAQTLAENIRRFDAPAETAADLSMAA